MGQLIHSLALNLYLLHERLQRVHGDLKPENILYSRTQRRFKLVDYGNSAPLESLSFYWDDFEFGSRLYRAPEIFVGMPFGMGVDIWALGALLFEALTAKALCSSLDSIVYLRQLCDLVGPLPVSFSTGKFYPKAGLPLVNDFEDISTEDGIFAEGASTAHPMGDGFWKRWRMSMLLQETGIKDVMLLDLLSQMLDPNPETRINIRQVLGHPFLASFMPFLPSLMPALEETTPTPTPAPRAGKEDIPPAASDNVDAEIEVLVSQLKKDDLTGKKGGRKAVITQGKRRKVI